MVLHEICLERIVLPLKISTETSGLGSQGHPQFCISSSHSLTKIAPLVTVLAVPLEEFTMPPKALEGRDEPAGGLQNGRCSSLPSKPCLAFPGRGIVDCAHPSPQFLLMTVSCGESFIAHEAG